MKTKNLLKGLLVPLLLLVSVISSFADVNYWYDLKRTVVIKQNHYVKSFSKAAIGKGGGYFIWIDGDNTSLADIAGVRIKPTSTTTGYWIRLYSGAINPDWMGASNSNVTWAAKNVSGADLNNWYGTGFAATTDNMDATAINKLFKQMETLGYQSVQFSPNKYFVNKQLTLPTEVSGVTTPELYVVDLFGAIIRTANSNTFNVIGTADPADQSVAGGSLVSRKFIIKDGTIDMAGAGQKGVYLACTYNSEIENLQIKGGDVAIELRFSLNCYVHNCNITSVGTYGIWVATGFGIWSGAGYTSSASNNVELHKCRIFCNSGMIAAMYFDGVSGGRVVGGTIENQDETLNIGILFDNKQVSTSKDFYVDGMHLEMPMTNGIYLHTNDGNLYVRNVYSQYNMNLVALESYSGNPQVTIDLVPYATASMKFLNIGSGTRWKMEGVKLGGSISTNTDLVATSIGRARWDTVTVGSTIPTASRVQYSVIN